MVIINYLNNRKNKRVEENNKNKKINEIEIAENNVKNVSKKIEVLEKEAKQKNNSEIQSIKFKYNKEIEEKEIDYLMKLNLVMLDNEIEELEKNVSSENIKLHTNKIDYQNLEENENLTVVLEEKFQRCIQERNELQSLGNSINIAKEAIEKAYNRMKSEITPKFTQNLSLIVEKISKGKYKNVKFIDGEGIIVELENGEYVNANKLSLGTIDQLYLSLRLSAIQEITEEHMPIIMDEAFAYYDEERLTNILKYLNELSNENQIIIFTCTNRESKILEQNNIRYKAIEL